MSWRRRFTYKQIMEIVEKHMADLAGGNYEIPSIIWTALLTYVKPRKNSRTSRNALLGGSYAAR